MHVIQAFHACNPSLHDSSSFGLRKASKFSPGPSNFKWALGLMWDENEIE